VLETPAQSTDDLKRSVSEQGSPPPLLLLVWGGSVVGPVSLGFVVMVLTAVAVGEEQAMIYHTCFPTGCAVSGYSYRY
jgi:hypothetical protein